MQEQISRMKEAAYSMAFSAWLRTGRVPKDIVLLWRELDATELELKFNPYHDPTNGRFTFAPGGPKRVQSNGSSMGRRGGRAAQLRPRADATPSRSIRNVAPRSGGKGPPSSPASSVTQSSTVIKPSSLRERASTVRARNTQLIRMPKLDAVLFAPGVSLLPVPVATLEDFDSAVNLANRMFDLDAVITGPQFDILLGSRGLDGQAVIDGRVYGNSSPDKYYVGTIAEEDGVRRMVFGRGDPPSDKVETGFGGGIPLLMDGKSVSGFGPAWARYEESSGTGKNIVAYNSELNTSAIFVQPDRESGYTLSQIRDYLRESGYNYALLFDGSGSVSLNFKGKQLISPQIGRQSVIPLAIGFRSK